MQSGFKTTLGEVLQGCLMIAFAAAAFYLVCPKFETHHSYRLNRITGQVVSLEEAKRQRSPWKSLTAMLPWAENYLHRKSAGPVTHETEWTRVVDRSIQKTAAISTPQYNRTLR